MNKQISAYVDRITEDGAAVIIAEEIKKEFVVEMDDSKEHIQSGDWLQIIVDENNETMIDYVFDAEKTQQKQQDVSQLLNKLRKNQRSKYRK